LRRILDDPAHRIARNPAAALLDAITARGPRHRAFLRTIQLGLPKGFHDFKRGPNFTSITPSIFDRPVGRFRPKIITEEHAMARRTGPLASKLAHTVLLALVAVASVGCGGGGDPPAPGASQTVACSSLNGKTIAGVQVTATNRFEATTGVTTAGVCQVLGTRAPFLDIEVVVPDTWSGRMVQQGGGGFDGRLASGLSVTNGALSAVHPSIGNQGSVYAASNGGNRASVAGQAAPAVWIPPTPDAQASADDYAYRAVGTTLFFAKEVAKAIHGTAPKRTYFNGCSNGGRNAYIAAQRWPHEYDGIVAGCETMDMAGAITGMLKTAAKAGTASEISPAQYAAAYTAAVAACDADDGLADGFLANPGACSLPPAALQCGQPGANADPGLCLSASQVGTLQGLLSDVSLSTGATAYSKYNWTNFASPSTIPNVPPMGVPSYGGLGGGFAFLATKDPLWFGALPPATTPAPNLATVDVDRHYYVFSSGLQRLGADHDKNAIAAYVASGGKLLSWHDAGDPLLSVNDHARNFATLSNAAKGLGLADPRTNARMFVVPASTHGAGGQLTEVDWLSAIIDWVENDHAPAQLAYSFIVGATARSMPVCEAPKYPRYNGSGDVNMATSFTCTAP
jgi:feruloyl esterase